MPKHQSRPALLATLLTALALAATACSGSETPSNATSSEPMGLGGKSDILTETVFPAARDLALIVPMASATIPALDVLPERWLTQIYDGLERSELAEDVSSETWPEDWKLVSGRFTVCNPLGRRAVAEEANRLCWPQVRLVWQPVVQDASVFGRFRDFYGDDRAIHTLYHVDHAAPALARMREHLASGKTVDDLSAEELESFDAARDRAGRALLTDLAALRLADGPYEGLDDRPEFFEPDLAEAFEAELRGFLGKYATPFALHELTAFSLPTGRNPAASDLWSFIAFEGEGGRLTPAPLTVHDSATGEPLFAFAHSEDVTTGGADGELLDALDTMAEETRARLEAQVIVDTAELGEKAARINDPAQTLVPNTTCTSCHRSNNINFNFHNLSYLEDQSISIAPRVVMDVRRDLALARKLWRP